MVITPKSSLKVDSSKKVVTPSLKISGAEDEAPVDSDKSPSELSTEALLFSEKALTSEETEKSEKKKIVIKPKVAPAKKTLKI